MTHLLVESSYCFDRIGGGCDSPRLFRATRWNPPKFHRTQRYTKKQMWITAKATDNADKSTPTAGQSSPDPGGIRRQCSPQSTRSLKSNKSSSSVNNLLKKIEELKLKREAGEWQREQDYKLIRERRKRVQKQIDAKLRLVRRLYIPAILTMLSGTVILFCATMRTIGEGTVFWNFREQFVVIGAVTIVIGVILLLTTVGLESCNLNKLKTEGIEKDRPIIHPDFLNEQTKLKKSCSSTERYGPNCRGLEKQRLLWDERNQNGEDFLCSSITSGSSIQSQEIYRVDPRSKWAKAMAINLSDDVFIDDTKTSKSQNHVSALTRQDSGYPRSIQSLPSIEISDVDETLPRSSSSPSSVANSAASGTINLPRCSQSKPKTGDSSSGANLSPRNVTVLKDGGKLVGISEESLTQSSDDNVGFY